MKIETVVARLGHPFAEFACRQRIYRALRMYADTVQHLVLDAVAHAHKEGLVEQCIGGQHAGHSAALATRLCSIPQRIHHIRCPVVDIVQRALDELHRARIKIQSLAVGKFQAQPRHRVGFVFVGAVTAEQQKVDAHAEMRALDQKCLPQRRSASRFC